MEGHMAKIGVGNVLASSAQSAGWKALTQLINSNSRFGIFDSQGNAFYEVALDKTEISIFNKTFTFLGGDSVVESGVTAFNYNKNYNVTTAPVESAKTADGKQIPGKTMAYNLVEQACQGQVTYVSTGTEKQRKKFEEALQAAQKSLELYELHTSERAIKNIKIIGYSVNRSASQGTQLIQYQITFQEILLSYNSVELVGAQTTYNDPLAQGEVETSTATGTQIQAASKKQ